MHTPKDVAEWMVKRLDRYGILNQQKAAHAIEKRFGPDFVYLLEGALSIDRKVLYQFRKLTGDDVVWVTQHGVASAKRPTGGAETAEILLAERNTSTTESTGENAMEESLYREYPVISGGRY